jgi:inner membrane protein involved in colicin E2 resistance
LFIPPIDSDAINVAPLVYNNEMNTTLEKENKTYQGIAWAVFYSLLVIFVIIMAVIFIPGLNKLLIGDTSLLLTGLVLVLLGLSLIIFTIKGKTAKPLRHFLLLTGASAIGIPLCILLHNLVYGSLIFLLGENFWKGGDEPFFFIMALIVFPVTFILGSVASIIIKIRQRSSV